MGQARKRGRPPDESGAKSKTLSLRIQPHLRAALAAAAKKNKRSLNKEIRDRLSSSHRDVDRPQHIKALSEIIARMASHIERVTGCQFNENRYTAEHLTKAIELLLWKYSPQAEAAAQTKAAIPPAVAAAAKTMPAPMRDTYSDQLGVAEAGAMIALLESTQPLLGHEEHWPPGRLPEGTTYPWDFWQIREHLNPRRRK
jgi:hypothetical protein